MHEYFPDHLRMKTARIKHDKDTEVEGKRKMHYYSSLLECKYFLVDTIVRMVETEDVSVQIRV